MQKRFIILILICLQQLYSENGSKDFTEYKVHLKGMGPIHIGASVEQIEKILGAKLTQEGDAEGEDNCTSFHLDENHSLWFLFVGKSKKSIRLARIYINNPNMTTLSGIQIGDPIAKLKQVYKGKLKEGREHYSNYLQFTYIPIDISDKSYGIIFETDNKNITEISVGKYPELQLAEGCS
ncbi:hypothetical protein EHQ81_08480 [Leptospira selangorensis]|uniref:Uncharacterized protein n=1 Tax=Leptospira selangorensis TaxID=2484982 RepID=A0A5F2BXX1_9LEPT|nr:hypothetical protein [Leptospira selangorensis]TGM14208.1 hypothetical protein EHQ81_08480 [Leptospira selangorensis]TGM16891.1 hypothetical protein EHQ82_16845 [Leptospira selangorensis]